MKNHNWYRLQNDPDNWIKIPEFHIFPRDVNFEGFAFPILGDCADDFHFLVPIQEIVATLRKEARSRFSTLSELKSAYGRVIIEATEFDDSFLPIDVSPSDAFATRYEILMSMVERCVQWRRGKKIAESAVHAVRIAAMLAEMASGNALTDADIKKIRSDQGKKGALARLAIDPKQADKKKVRDCWELWQNDKGRYKSKAAFARDMLEKFENLENHRVLERWCKEWESEPSQ